MTFEPWNNFESFFPFYSEKNELHVNTHTCNKVFDFRSILPLVLVLSWKGEKRADSFRIGCMSPRQHRGK